MPNVTFRSGVLEQREVGELLQAEATAGAGTLEQKSWSLARAVTIIGSSRHAHIRIDEPDIEPVHAALLNTADAIVLADLNSRQGVFFDGRRVKTQVLQPADSFRLGTRLLQVDFTSSECRRSSAQSVLSLSTKVELASTRGATGQWSADAVGTVIGSRERCDIRLESRDVLPLHAVLTRVGEQVVLASLAADKPIRINSGSVSASVLEDGDMLTIWPIVLRVSMTQQGKPAANCPDGRSLAELQEQEDMSTTTRHLCQWQQQLEDYAAGLVRRDAVLTHRAQELDDLQVQLQQKEGHLQRRWQETQQAQAALDEQRRSLEEQVRQFEARKLALGASSPLQREPARYREI